MAGGKNPAGGKKGRKIGRNREKCQRYEVMGTRERNKRRRQERRERKLAKRRKKREGLA